MRRSCFSAPILSDSIVPRKSSVSTVTAWYRRPFAVLQVFGDLFEQADQSGDFVLGKINRTVGTRAAGITAPATYETLML